MRPSAVSLVLVVSLLVVSLLVGAAPGRSDPPTPPDKKDKPDTPKKDGQGKPPVKLPTGRELMQAKLKHTQALIEGLALGDLKKVEGSADALVQIGGAAEFLSAYKSADYELQAAVFRRSAEAAARNAKEKNLDGAMLAYLDLTMTCVKCHRSTRDAHKGNAARPPLPTSRAATPAP